MTEEQSNLPSFPETDHEGRERFVLAYYHQGQKIEAAIREAGITRSLGYLWRDQPWFKERYKEVRALADRLTEQEFSRLLRKTTALLEDRIDNGDPKYIPAKYNKDGDVVATAETVRVGIGAHTAAIVAGVLFDKREKLRAIPEGKSNDNINQLERIADKLKSTMERQLKLQDSNVIDVPDATIPQPLLDVKPKGKPGRKPKVKTVDNSDLE